MFTWTPNSPRDVDAEARLTSNAPMPSELMGEAWFMGESRKMYPELKGDLEYISTNQLQDILTEISSGATCFGPMDEWVEWYRYLMPRLLNRSHESFVSYTLEMLNTCFFALHPDERTVVSTYPDFHRDVVSTLGSSMMEAPRWSGNRVDTENALHSFGVAKTGYLMYSKVSGDLSSSMFFCSKYLNDKNFDSWLSSAIAIDCPHWRAQLIVWFTDAYPLFAGEIRYVSELGEDSAIDWSWSHALAGEYAGADSGEPKIPFLADDNRETKFEVLKYRLKSVGLSEWLDSIAHIGYLRDAVENSSLRFSRLYS